MKRDFLSMEDVLAAGDKGNYSCLVRRRNKLQLIHTYNLVIISTSVCLSLCLSVCLSV